MVGPDLVSMQPTPAPDQTVVVTGLSNREFLERYARPGRIGLSGGFTLIDKAICRAERHLDEREQWGSWSHAFLFQGQRPDGHHWVIESDLQMHRKHIQLGVQENRIAKYYDEALYASLAVLDLGLTEAQIACLLREGLELVANRARESSLYCSALVQHLFRKAGLDLAPGVDLKNTTPEDIARTAVPHTTYLLQRQAAPSKLTKLKARLRHRVGAGIRQLKRHKTKPA